jgi:aspartate dehydrogenase
MPKKIKIGIVGCGAIGSSMAKTISRHFTKQASLTALYDIDNQKSVKLSRILAKNLSVKNLGQVINKSDLVIESASAASSWNIAKSVLGKGRSIMIMSVGGVVSHYPQLCNLARRHNAKAYIPSGAISGVDALKAAGMNKIRKVILTTRKHPLSFKGVKYVESRYPGLKDIKKDKVLFFGPAASAVKYFPQNINVAAVLSIAGIGQDKTLVKIIASASVKKNTHEIHIESEAATIFTRTENLLHPDNPKTSYLAVLSAAATLKQILHPVKVGT